ISSSRIMQWFKDKIDKKEFELIGLVNIISPNETEYIWDRKIVKDYKFKTPYWIGIFKVKNNSLSQ
ncbi:MAG: hypothetical protein N3E50_04465, partial [Candidatus Goldbacteria bacterium]|nr:hypothetical protein [Candidatus Goldiibacteriota bacterium]